MWHCWINMPGMNELEVLKRIMSDNAKHQILMLCTYQDDTRRRIRLSYQEQPHRSADIRNPAPGEGERYIDPELAEKLLFDLGPTSAILPHSTLSDREFNVLKLIALGVSLIEISQKLALSSKTVSTYRARILEKMNMQNNAQLIRYVAEHKLLD